MSRREGCKEAKPGAGERWRRGTALHGTRLGGACSTLWQASHHLPTPRITLASCTTHAAPLPPVRAVALKLKLLYTPEGAAAQVTEVTDVRNFPPTL